MAGSGTALESPVSGLRCRAHGPSLRLRAVSVSRQRSLWKRESVGGLVGWRRRRRAFVECLGDVTRRASINVLLTDRLPEICCGTVRVDVISHDERGVSLRTLGPHLVIG